MNGKSIRWFHAIIGFVVAEVATIAASIAWVAIYSHVINPGQPFATYEAHAQESGPWISILAGFPVFYFACRWIAKSVPTSMALFVIFFLVDLTLILALAGLPSVTLGLQIIASYVTKCFACFLGGRHANRQRDQAKSLAKE